VIREDNDQSSGGDDDSDYGEESVKDYFNSEGYLRLKRILSGESEWYSENVPFKMYHGNEVPTDTYGEITGEDEGKAKVCLDLYYNYILTL